jgi:cell division septal protein FtsQ|tara:strand:- start:5315 stop:5983 length:669 start_codon:yes stop_codon:yes gene_type:complete
MIPKNKFLLLFFFFIILTTYNSNDQKYNSSIIFPIKKIIIDDAYAFDLIMLKSELEFLINTSLFFLKKKEIIKVTAKYDFISSVQLKKKYPNTLKILISENIPVATGIDGNKRYYLTKEGVKINYREIDIFKSLPIIFGNHKNFSIFFNILKKNNFKIKKIKAFYYFDAERWDIVLKDERTIKLPQTNYENILKEIDSILNDSSFSKYKIFDYRIKNQLILQ